MHFKNNASPRNFNGTKYDKEVVRRNAQNHIEEILRDICSVPAEVVEAARNGQKREFPCPKCGGKTRFRVTDIEKGRVFCSHCCTDKNSGCVDVLGAVMWATGCNFNDALHKIVDYLDLGDVANAARRSGFASGFDSSVGRSTKTPNDAKLTEIERENERPTGAEKPDSSGSSGRLPATSRATTEFDYRDESGAVRWRVIRSEFFDANGVRTGKTFRQGRVVDGVFQPGLNGESLPPYRLPELSRPDCRVVFIVEGEKCADALQTEILDVINGANEKAVRITANGEMNVDNIALFFESFYRDELELDGDSAEAKAFATTLGGASNAGKWREYAELLRGKAIVVCADADQTGREAAQKTAEALLAGGVENVSILPFDKDTKGQNAPEKYDVADWLTEANAATGGDDERKISGFFKYLYGFWEEPDCDAAGRTEPASPREAGFDASVGRSTETPNGAKSTEIERENERPTEAEKPDSSGSSAPVRPVAPSQDDLESLLEANAPEFPLEAFDYIRENLCSQYAKLRAIPSGAPAVAALVVPSASIGFRATIDIPKMERYETPPCLSGWIVGDSGSGKSDVLNDFSARIQKIQDKINVQTLEERRRIAEENALKKRNEPQTPYPFHPVYYIDSGTTEGLERRLTANRLGGVQNGVLYKCDEGKRFFVPGTYQTKGASKDIASYINLLDGKAPNKVLKTEETIPCDKVCLSILGGVQPGPLGRAFKNEQDVVDTGLIHRFVYAYVPFTREKGNREAKVGDYMSLFNGAQEKIERTPPTRFVIDGEAFDVLDKYEDEVRALADRFKKRGADELATHALKSIKLAVVVALNLRVFDWAVGYEEATSKTPVPFEWDFSEFGLDEFKPFDEPPEEYRRPPEPLIDAATMERAVSVARWAVESFAHFLNVLRRSGRRDGIVASSHWTREKDRVTDAIDALSQQFGSAPLSKIGDRVKSFNRSPKKGGLPKAERNRLLRELEEEGRIREIKSGRGRAFIPAPQVVEFDDEQDDEFDAQVNRDNVGNGGDEWRLSA